LVLIFLASFALALSGLAPYPPQVNWFPQVIDHFNQERHPNTWSQRYLTWDRAWDTRGPIFFYTGNEGDITSFYDNSQFILEAAQQFNALVIFAEHRYYGESWPFGTPEKSLTRENIGYLSVEQALADYAVLLTTFKNNVKSPKLPVVAFGGSYGGMLCAWFRMKYPHIVQVAVSASAPIPMGTGGVNFRAKPEYFETVTNDFKKANPACPDLVRQGFNTLATWRTKPGGLKYISQEFSLCKQLTDDRFEHLILWIENSFGNLAMMDYPYPTNFLAPLPAWPIRLSCQIVMQNQNRPLYGLAQAAGLFYNGTGGTLSCFDIETEFIECADQTGCGTGPAGQAWDYQACTEIIYFPNTNNHTDMFPPRQWTLNDLTNHCNQTWGIIPNPDWLATYLGGSDLNGASNIIFSNGNLDPWHGGGFLKSQSDTLISVIIEDGAHHLDLRGSNPLDPQSVKTARNQELMFVKKVLDRYYEQEGIPKYSNY